MASERPVLRIAYIENAPQVTDEPLELIKRALNDLGYKTEFTALPFARSVMMANAGEFDAELVRFPAIEQSHPNLVRVPVPIRVIKYVPVTLGDLGIKLPNWSAIVAAKLRVGARVGGKLTESMIPREQLTSVSNYDSLLRMLLLRRIDVAIVPQGLLRAYYGNMPPELQGLLKDVREMPIFAIENMYFYLHRKHAALAPAIATALQCSQETLPKKGTLPAPCRKQGVTSIKTSR